MRTLQLDQSQILSFNEHHTRISTINDGSDYLSANKITDDLNTELLHDNLDDDFLNEYAHEVDDDGIAFYDASDDFHCNEDEEINEKNDEGEDTLTEEQMNYADEFINMGASSIPIRQYDELDISVILLMVKKKHKCTNSLVNDILKLLIALKVPRIPTSWYKPKALIQQADNTHEEKQQMVDLTLYFCQECEQQSTDPNKCTNESCSSYLNSLIIPHTFIMLNIQQQIEQVLKSIHQTDLNLTTQTSNQFPTTMSDIYHGRVYKNIINSLKNEHHKLFISLTCNIDGAAVYTSSEQSMWAFTACLNELNRSIRFNMDKIIVFAISVGRKKPSKIIMQKMLVPIVFSLKQLQKSSLYQISDCSHQMLRTYLIAVSNDKPANSLVQNLPEPNALFGCSKCEIAGETTPAKVYATPTKSAKIKTTYIRIFPTSTGRQPEMRSNARWYDISHATQNGIRFFINDHKLHTYGYMGECELCELAFIDRGSSFMSDTLHSVYHGAFKKLLHLWTESSKKQPWSLTKALPSIAGDLAKILYPTTTVRVPRTITKFLKLKANECRVLLLIGYPVFKNYLPELYYKHLQKLAFGISIGESFSISLEKVEEMELLLKSFVDDFPYNKRYIVQTVHCVKHFATTAKDFGPLSNYSTFNYESVIGCLSSSIHGTKRIGTELSINLELFTKAYYISKHHSLSSELEPFIEYVKTGKMHLNKQYPSSEFISTQELNSLYKFIPRESNIKLMKSVVRNGLVLSTFKSSKSSTFTNACIVYKYQNFTKYGIIENIFHITPQDLYEVLQFGGAVPVQSINEEPRILFLYLNLSIDLHRHLRFYNSIATVFDSEDDLRSRLIIPDRLYDVVALLPDQVFDQAHSFNQINFEPYTNVDYIYQLYKMHSEFVTIMRNRHQQPPVLRSSTDDTLEKIIWIISKSLDRNVKYYEERARQSEENGDHTLAALYEQLRLERNQLRIAATDQLLDLL
ncbi:unnamed protein product [Adineta steineri]|uniref:Uncharacterized protein n=1 Tax=Adineta steineri TaxID=433720 RepID=A0A819HGN4_9BILA|nr:unnamed protein product [Adineta steineri]